MIDTKLKSILVKLELLLAKTTELKQACVNDLKKDVVHSSKVVKGK